MESERKELCDDELEKVTGGGKGTRPKSAKTETEFIVLGTQSVVLATPQETNAFGVNGVVETVDVTKMKSDV